MLLGEIIGIYYILANHTKKEWVDFSHCSKREPIWHHNELIASYLHKNNGDFITFVNDCGELCCAVCYEYKEVTTKAYRDLICEYCNDIRTLIGILTRMDAYKNIYEKIKDDEEIFKEVLECLKSWKMKLTNNSEESIKYENEKYISNLNKVIEYITKQEIEG